jgi:hypothetical protein
MNTTLFVIVLIIVLLLVTQIHENFDTNIENYRNAHSYRRFPRQLNHKYNYGYEWHNYPFFGIIGEVRTDICHV